MRMLSATGYSIIHKSHWVETTCITEMNRETKTVDTQVGYYLAFKRKKSVFKVILKD